MGRFSITCPAIRVLSLYAAQQQADTGDCVAYLEQDIHNKLIVINKSTGQEVSSSSLCQNPAENSSSGFSVEYAGVGVGFDQASAVAKAMCDNHFSESDFSNGQSVYQSVVDPNILAASVECFKLNAKG